jgi:membrane peptidoglycan carboxypeptidase
VLWGLLAAFVLFGGLAGLAYARTTIPTPSAIASAQTTTIYYSDGKTVLAHIGATNRTDVPLSQVPKPVQHAVLAAEDRHFYSEPGISPTGIVRALWVDLRGGDVTQGGSTITQQYAKNAYLSPRRSLTRKLKEILIAAKLGQTRSKGSILDDYLNTIYFGRNAYGIEAAAKAYFKHVSGVQDLNVSQGALLAAVVRAPAFYDPRLSAATKAAAIARWHYVINGMVAQGWLSQAKAGRLHFPHYRKKLVGSANCHATLCFIRDDVEHELTERDGLSQSQLDLGGYKIVTTIDKTAEQSLINAEHAVLPHNNRGTPESGAVAIKPGDGAIEALYGGSRYCHKPKLNKDACVDLTGISGVFARPPGSSFKAFTLLAALKSGISLSSVFDGPPTVTVNGAQISNSSPGESCYGCNLVTAFAKSINTIFVPLAQKVGPDKVVQAAYDAGIPKQRKLEAVPDVTLGPNDVAPVDLADAYATIAANGVQATPYLVQSVTTSNGQQIFKASPDTTSDALGGSSKSVTSDAIYAMTKVLQPGGTAYGHALSGRPSAGKTGTVGNEQTGQNVDAWFTGFTPQLCMSVWIGNVNRNQAISGGVGEVFGGTLPATIWQQAMNAALVNQPVKTFPPPAHGGVVEHTARPTPTSSSASAKPTKTATPSPTPTPTKPSKSPSPTPTPTKPTPTPTVTPTSSPTKLHPSHARRR